MSSYNSFALPHGTFIPPFASPHGEFPFDYIVPGTWVRKWQYPFEITPDQAMKLYWRGKEMMAQFSLVTSSHSFNYDLPLVRKIANIATPSIVQDEVEFDAPGIHSGDSFSSPLPCAVLYEGTIREDDWDGPDTFKELTIRLWLFFKGRVAVDGPTVDIEHMEWKADDTAIAPSVYVEVLFDFSASDEDGTYEASNAPNTSDFEADADILVDEGGDTIPLYFTTHTEESPTFGLSIEGSEWFTWLGKYSATTGEKVVA